MSKLYKDQIIVITGAAGFIGSCLVRYLNNKGYSNLVLVDDLKESPKWKNLRQKSFLELVSRHEIFDWIEGRESEIEAFIHMGACSSTTVTDGDYIYQNNYRFTIRLAEYALENNIPFIAASSAATYGDGSRGFCDDHEGLLGLSPMNLYGWSKYAIDAWAFQQGVLDRLVFLKYFNVFGPNEYDKGGMASMIFHGYHQIVENGSVKLFKSNHPDYGDGEQVRDFIYVKDVVEMTCDFLTNDIRGVFNIGTGKPVSWNVLMKAIFKALDKDPKIEYIDMPAKLQKAYQNYTSADMTKYHLARKEKGLKPFQTMEIEEAVEDYVLNYLDKGDTVGDHQRW